MQNQAKSLTLLKIKGLCTTQSLYCILTTLIELTKNITPDAKD